MEEGAALAELNQPERAQELLERGMATETQHPVSGTSPRFLAESNAHLADLEARTGHAQAARQRLEKFLASQGYPRRANLAIELQASAVSHCFFNDQKLHRPGPNLNCRLRMRCASSMPARVTAAVR